MRIVPSPDANAIPRITRERDLYRRLLDLGEQSELEPFLKAALALIVEITEARRAYLELHDPTGQLEQETWHLSHGFSDTDIEDILSSISRGVVAEALASGQTVITASALDDERFSARESVRIRRIDAVLCAPVGGAVKYGVVYLQGRTQAEPFSEDDCANVEIFARHLAPLADRLLVRQQVMDSTDPMRGLRAKYKLDSLVGRSAALAAAVEQAMHAAPLDVNVLLSGESGTGKSQLAGIIHANSSRSAGPFVELNCATLPETLIESELFGARKGAHSSATHDIKGKVAAAEGGTLLLDEIAELPLTAQAKLLQLLQERQYYPLGATSAETSDARIIAATNVDLREAVDSRRFREDLFYRLQVLPIRMPSLDERRGDISDLAHAFCRRACEHHRLDVHGMSAGALRAIEASVWPGNVRELYNAVEAGAVRAAGQRAQRVESRHVFPHQGDFGGAEDRELSFQEATQRFQRQLLEKTLAEEEGNVTRTARRLDLSRSHVYNLMEAFSVKR